jgi:hypothetical protein
MKRIFRAALVCLVCVLLAGCPPTNPQSKPAKHTHSFSGYADTALVVDGIAYNYFGAYELKEKDGEFACSLIIVFPDRGQHYYPSFINTNEETKGRVMQQKDFIANGTERTTWSFSTNLDEPETNSDKAAKIADVDLNYVYLVDNGEIVFQKSNEELNIVFPSPKGVGITSYLKPFLENMIRQSVKPQEPETKETE